ncbi:LCP family protein [Embleya sp. NBC_00896]|uniref:LCP family glycopolymer transferase n=1 Tax=Embleya sp. NBC_00896 TaxID=2975961 RepID=UPI00386FFDBC|nr:LCP family protein [Embleya sp. NBC_00896]
MNSASEHGGRRRRSHASQADPDATDATPVGDVPDPTGADDPAAAPTPVVPRARRADGGRGGRGNRGGRKGKRTGHGKPRRFRKLKITALVMSLVLVAIGITGFVVYQKLNGNIKHSKLNTSDVEVPKEAPDEFGRTPINILMIGSDGRNDPTDCKLGGACDGGAPRADVQMLLHVSADRSNASVISIPRDTRVPIPSCTDPKTKQKFPATNALINESLGRGGPGCVVGTWQQLTKIHIDHFMMVTFSGVVSMADAVGGVKVCVLSNIQDERVEYVNGERHVVGSHLKLTAGEHEIQGEDALKWLRTRHAFEDGSDVGRAHAQHMYLNSMVRTLKAKSTITNPVKLFKVAEAATKALTVDDGLGGIPKLTSLATTLNKVPTNRITMTTMPHDPDPQAPEAHLVPSAGAETLFKLVRADVPFDKNGPPPGSETPPPTTEAPPAPPTVDKAAIRVSVVNATTGTSRADAVAAALVAQGFTKATKESTTARRQTSSVIYPAKDQEQAQAVADALGLPATALSSQPNATHVTVQLGTDWGTGTTYKGAKPTTSKPPTTPPPPPAGELPKDSRALNASDESACMKVYTEAKDRNGKPIYTW